MKAYLLGLLVSIVVSANITSKTLVLLDNDNLRNTHSTFFKKLQKFGEVSFAHANQKEIKLKYYDEYLYDQIIIMCTSSKESDTLKPTDLVSFFDSGRNIFVVADIDASRAYRKMFYSFGVELDQVGHQLKDNFNNINGQSISITTTKVAQVAPFVTDKLPHGKIAYRGLGLKLVNYINHQLFALARAEETTYSRNEITKKTTRLGSEIVLAAAVQGLNNARAILTGSLDLFSDQFMNLAGNDNEVYADNLLRWVYKESGILRTENVKYYSVQKHSHTLYTCTDKVHYQLDVEEYDHHTSSWKPYVAQDLMVEFVMLDPWIITKLNNHVGTSTYSAEFVTPTKAGIYQYKFIYEKPGYNFISLADRVTVRPKKHDEFDRFLVTAMPYYASTFATIIGSIVFIIFYLYTRPSHAKED